MDRVQPPMAVPPLQDAQRQYVELFGSSLVLNTYLKIALLCVSLVAVGLLAFCGHMLGSRDEAEDVLQHSFVSAYRALRDSDSDIALRPWLYTIARNRCLSELRSRRETLAAPADDECAYSLDGLPADVQRRAELRDLVEDMQRLPDDQLAALVLFELGDHSHSDIATVLGVRKEKVKALVFQARCTWVNW